MKIESKECKALVTFNNTLCALMKDATSIRRFKGEKEIQRLEIPPEIGVVHSIGATDTFFISGGKGYVVFDSKFKQKCLNLTKLRIDYVGQKKEDVIHLFGEYKKADKYFHQTYSKPKECLDCKDVFVKESNSLYDYFAEV